MAAVWEAFKDMAVGAIGLIVDVFINLPLDLMRAVAPLAGKFALIVADFAVNLVGKIVKLIQGMPDKIVELLGAVASDVIAAGLALGGNIVSGIVSAISGAGSAIWDAVKGTMQDFVPDWLPGWLNPFDGGPSVDPASTRRPTSARRAGASIPSMAGLGGGIMNQLDLSRGSTDWFQNPETIIHFRKAGMLADLQKFKSMGDVAGMESFVAGGMKTSPVIVNVQGDVLSEELVDRIRVGLLEAQNSGKQLVV